MKICELDDAAMEMLTDNGKYKLIPVVFPSSLCTPERVYDALENYIKNDVMLIELTNAGCLQYESFHMSYEQYEDTMRKREIYEFATIAIKEDNIRCTPNGVIMTMDTKDIFVRVSNLTQYWKELNREGYFTPRMLSSIGKEGAIADINRVLTLDFLFGHPNKIE